MHLFPRSKDDPGRVLAASGGAPAAWLGLYVDPGEVIYMYMNLGACMSLHRRLEVCSK